MSKKENQLRKIAGIPIPVPSIEQTIYQPKIKEIAMFGEEYFFISLGVFAASDTEEFIAQQLKKIPEEEIEQYKVQFNYEKESGFLTNFKVFLKIIESDKFLENVIKSFLYLIFPNISNVYLDEAVFQLSFREQGKEESKTSLITEVEFEEIKTILEECFSYETEADKEKEFNPANDMAAEIARKMEEAAAKRAINNGSANKKNEESILSNMASTLATSDGLSLEQVLNLTFPQLFIQTNRTMLLKQYTSQITLGAFGGLDADDIVNWQKPI